MGDDIVHDIASAVCTALSSALVQCTLHVTAHAAITAHHVLCNAPNEAVLVKLLCQIQGLLGRHAELARGNSLHGYRGQGGRLPLSPDILAHRQDNRLWVFDHVLVERGAQRAVKEPVPTPATTHA